MLGEQKWQSDRAGGKVRRRLKQSQKCLVEATNVLVGREGSASVSQSLSRSRTSEGWKHKNNRHKRDGRAEWYRWMVAGGVMEAAEMLVQASK